MNCKLRQQTIFNAVADRFASLSAPKRWMTARALERYLTDEKSLNTCAADFHADGIANTLDFLAFLNAFSNGLPAADFNIDGRLNTLDFLAFLNAYSIGCP